jgi:hypothetical protein
MDTPSCPVPPLYGSTRSTVLLLAFVLLASGHAADAQSVNNYAQDFVKATFQSPETLWEPALSAGGSVAWNDFVSPIKGFGPGFKGYAHHYTVALADNVNGKFMRQFAFAAAAHHEDNYSPTSGGLWTRVVLAAAHTIYVCPGTDGWGLTWKTVNWSGIPASFASAALSNVYQPGPQRNLTSTFERVGTGTAGYAVGNVLTALATALKSKHPRLHVALRNRYMN